MLLLLLHSGDRQIVLLLLRQFPLAPFQFLLKFLVANLLYDLRIAGFVHLKNLPAVRAFDLLHDLSTSRLYSVSFQLSIELLQEGF